MHNSTTLFLSIFVAAVTAFAKDGPLLSNIQFETTRDEQRPVHFLPRVVGEGAITIDGKLDDPFWKNALKLDGFINQEGTQAPTTLWIAYDHKYLYVGFRCEAEDMSKLVSKGKEGDRDGDVWSGSCVDFKVDVNGTGYQFLVNPAGAFTDMKDGDRSWNAPVEVKTSSDDKAYLVEMKIRSGAFNLGEPRGDALAIAFGRTGPAESLQTLSVPYGDTSKAPLFVLGDADAYRKRLDAAMASRNVNVSFYMDREVYPSFERMGTGRIRLNPQGGDPLKGKLALAIAIVKDKKDVALQRIEPLKGTMLDFDMNLDGIAPGEYTVELRFMDGDDVFNRVTRRLVIRKAEAQRSGAIPITIPACPAELTAYPITFGVPFPWGVLDSDESVKLVNESGQEIPIQTQITDRWSRKGSVRWLLIDAVVPVKKTAQAYSLAYGPNVRRSPIKTPVTVKDGKTEDGREAVSVESGTLRMVVPKTGSPGIAELYLSGSQVLKQDAKSGPYLVDEAGKAYYGAADPNVEVVVESSGPIKACVRVSGWHVSDKGEKLGRYTLRYRVFPGLPYVLTDHTFIITANSDKVRYRDIGYSLKTWSARGVFGAPRIVPFELSANDSSAYLLQRDDLTGKVVQNGEFMEDFGKAEGWMSGGSLAVSVRDFWQNFPKEFEVRPDRTIVHFWPAHNEEPTRTKERMVIREVPRIWSAHEGPLLNFRVPPEVGPLLTKDGSAYDEAVFQVNAMGVAKTHQMLLHFHDGNWDRNRVRSVHRVFQFEPTGICDPKWVCATDVFGQIAPRDPERFPEIEKAVDGYIARFIREQAEDRDYGMWNFGDAHHNWIWGQRRWALHRAWRATHHNWPRWPWIQYARSGSMDTLAYARRNAYHVADISHCHHTDEEFTKAKYPTQKIVGGTCDYKGLVHWSAGERLCYNSVADSVLQHYYLTGDERSRTTALEYGAAILANNRTQGCREGSGRIISLVALYFHTWNNDYLELLERHVDKFERKDLEKTVAKDANLEVLDIWTPNYPRYVDLNGSLRGQSFVNQWADFLSRTGDKAIFPSQDCATMPNPSVLSILSHSYLYTGNEILLRKAAYRNSIFTVRYEGDDPRYEGSPVLWDQNMPVSWWLMEVPTYLRAVEKYGKPPVPLQPLPRHEIASLMRAKVDGKEWFVFHARIKQSKEGPFSIRLPLANYGHIAELQPVGGGKVLRVNAKPGKLKTEEIIQMDVPADDALEYAFRIRSTNSYDNIPLPIASGQEGIKEVYPMITSNGPIQVVGGDVFHFDLPEGTKRVDLNYGGQNGQQFEIWNPAGQRVYGEVTVAENGPRVAHLQADGALRGWSLRYLSNEARGRVMLRPTLIEPATSSRTLWLSVGPERFFWPSADEWKWE